MTVTLKRVATKKVAKRKPNKVSVKVKAGVHMTSGAGWQLIKNGRIFRGTLVDTVNAGDVRVAIFKVPK